MSRAFRIVVVCTANICRSPMAEAMIRHALRPSGAAITVESAGVYGHEGSPIAPGSPSSSAVTTAGPIGAKPSEPFARSHWRSSRWRSRIVTSLRIV